MTNLQQAERLAEIKGQMKELEKEAKAIQKDMLDAGSADKIKTAFGTLTKGSRITYNPIDTDSYVTEYGVKAFLEAATITASNVKKTFGETGLKQLDQKGMLTIGRVSEYYTLRK